MNSFEKVCEDCPLRTKVDVARAAETGSWGTDGVGIDLYDGANRQNVSLSQGELLDSVSANTVYDQLENNIATCEGAHDGIFRSKCGAGLASAWRWTEVIGSIQPNIHSAEEIIPLLNEATYRDAMPYSTEDSWLVGDPRDFSEMESGCGERSGFDNRAIRKLSTAVRGTSAELGKGKAVMIDKSMFSYPSSDMKKDIYRIRIAQGGPQFVFRYAPKKAIDEILSEGIFKFLNSTTDDLEESTNLINTIFEQAQQHYDEMTEYMTSGNFKRDLERVMKDRDVT
jgi:hypothetical protein